MIILDEFVKLNVREEFWNLFLVVIQLGAILAVVLLFWNQIFPLNLKDKNKPIWKKDILLLWAKILVACVPAGIVGVLFDDVFDKDVYKRQVLVLVTLFFTWQTGGKILLPQKMCIRDRNMAAFFRYNIKKDHDEVTLEEEIRLVDNYIYILNVRFSGEIHFEKKVDESLLGVHIPSMLLQPIVENSVNYGIRNIDWEGRIVLSVYREEEKVCISIKDNGVGMTEERIAQVMQNCISHQEDTGDSNGVGLNNVMERLHLFFDGAEDVYKRQQKMVYRVEIQSM